MHLSQLKHNRCKFIPSRDQIKMKLFLTESLHFQQETLYYTLHYREYSSAASGTETELQTCGAKPVEIPEISHHKVWKHAQLIQSLAGSARHGN